jgi:DNA-binding transcriptional LysR family regulator
VNRVEAAMAAAQFPRFEIGGDDHARRPWHGEHRRWNAFQAAGIDRRIRATGNEIALLRELVAHGVGIAILPRHLALATHVPIRLIELTGISMVWTVGVVTRSSRFRNLDAQAMWNDINATAQPVQNH